jgi:hypothetical protein
MSESEKTTETPRRGSGPWYVWGIILASPLFVLGTFLHLGPVFRYFEGLRNEEAGLFGVPCLVQLILVLCVLAGLPALVIRMIISWPKHIRSRRRLWALRLLLVPGLLAYCAVWFTPLPPSPRRAFIRGFEKYMKGNVDVPAIQTWLSTLDPNVPSDLSLSEEGEFRVFPEEDTPPIPCPECILRLEPKHADLARLQSGRLHVQLYWGAFWSAGRGLVVGDKEMEIPQTEPPGWYYYPPDTREERIRIPGRYCSPLAPGAYVWYEIE